MAVCGIAGFVADGDERLLTSMTDCLTHRGPDDSGLHIDSLPNGRQVGLGSRRLAILDPSPRGRMPMEDSEAETLIVHNGEVYNFLELRLELAGGRERLRTETDTEVLLRLYRQEGSRIVHRLNGMFAFAIWDRSRGTVYLFRDRLGIKPLYYHHSRRGFFFASEIKSLLTAGLAGNVNWNAVWDYFTYLYVPGPRTAYEGIRELPPGHLLEYDVGRDRLQVRPYWEPASVFGSHRAGELSVHDACARLRALLEMSVRRRMLSDVPLGVFLSGGVDSSVITGLMAEQSTEPVRTFTVLFPGSDSAFHDERETARSVARQWGTDHREIAVDISVPDEMWELVSCFDQPFANPTYYLSYLISRAVSKHAKVALSGAGGDELFAGYPRYVAARFSASTGRTPRWLSAAVLAGIGVIPDDGSSPTLRRLKNFLGGIDSDPARQYMQWVYYMKESQKRRLLKAERFPDPPDSSRVLRKRWEEAASFDWLARAQYVDLVTFLPDNILAYTDRTSMATSLEVRVPWLDHELVEFSFSLPARMKLRRNTPKYLVRRTFSDYIPAATLRGPKKGFVPPLGQWMRTALDSYFDSYLTSERMDRIGIFDRGEVSKLREAHWNGQRDYSMELFSIMVFDAWYRRYIE
ncbi:MAG: asparagine synthase (glutamine-hydrolyzing) [Gemmatimonadota bacterium]